MNTENLLLKIEALEDELLELHLKIKFYKNWKIQI
jgi:hypothetical protein